jgi:hypothetical protein
VKERRTGPAVFLGDLNGHHAEIEQTPDKLVRNARVFVHLAHARRDLATGKLQDALEKQPLVLVEHGQRSRGWGLICGAHGSVRRP